MVLWSASPPVRGGGALDDRACVGGDQALVDVLYIFLRRDHLFESAGEVIQKQLDGVEFIGVPGELGHSGKRAQDAFGAVDLVSIVAHGSVGSAAELREGYLDRELAAVFQESLDVCAVFGNDIHGLWNVGGCQAFHFGAPYVFGQIEAVACKVFFPPMLIEIIFRGYWR